MSAKQCLVFFAICLLLPLPSSAAGDIPQHILDKLSRQRTSDELRNFVRLNQTKVRPVGGGFQQFSIGGFGGGRVGDVPVAPIEWDPNIPFQKDPVQSEDKCELWDVCVPVPVQRLPGRWVFPACVSLRRCVGACCSAEDSCHATSSSQVGIVAAVYQYQGEDPATSQPVFSHVENVPVVMNQSLACGCKACGPGAPVSCPPGKELRNCRCQCTRSLLSSCPEAEFWDEENCRCQCAVRRCLPPTAFDPVRCECRDERVQKRSTPSLPTSSADSPSNLAKWFIDKLRAML